MGQQRPGNTGGKQGTLISDEDASMTDGGDSGWQ